MSHRNRTIRLILPVILIALSILWITYTVVTHVSLYTTRFNPESWRRAYEKSQWMDPLSKAPIGDDGLYGYAGYRYIQGENPILINPETPPIGKYLIGISIVLFGNQRTMSLISAIVSLVFIGLITRLLSRSSLAAATAVFLTAINSLFTDQITTAPQLDIFQLMFLMMFMYAFLRYQAKKTMWGLIIAGVVMGLFLSIKVLTMFFLLINVFLALYYLLRKRPVREYVYEVGILNLAALVTFTVGYVQLFLHGGTLRSFAGTQKWIYEFYAKSQIQSPALYGTYLTLIFANKWRVWSAGFPYVSYDQWSIVWPLEMIAGVSSTILLLRRKVPKAGLLLLVAFLIIYNAFLFFVPLFPRYLLLLFVPFNIIIGFYIATIFP